jgi:prolyl-tRNA synthetase
VAASTVTLARRTGGKKESLPLTGLAGGLAAAMDVMQRDMLETARSRREANTLRGATKDQLVAHFDRGGGFVYSGFCGRGQCEAEIKEQTKATIRVLPDEEFRSPEVPATCMWCGRPSVTEAVWARAY